MIRAPLSRCAAWPAAALVLAVLAACTSAPRQGGPAGPGTELASPMPAGPVAGDVLGRGDWFVIYRPGSGDTLATIAAHFLGSAERAWSIADFNGIRRAEPGQPLVVPLRTVNPGGVSSEEYQTVPILAYHRFGGGGGKMVVSPSSFAAQLEWLARNDYRVIPLRQLVGYLAGKEPLPQRAVVITIDDGYESTYRYAFPLLRKYGFPATVFVYTDFVGAGDALNWNQLHELAASGLVDVQAHSKTHRNLIERTTAESDQQYRQGLEMEVRAPRDILERNLSVQVRHYAFPYGDANETVLDILGRQQYQLAVTVHPGGNPFFAQPFMLKRTMIFGDHSLEAFKARLQTSRPIANGGNGAALRAGCAAVPVGTMKAGCEPLPQAVADDRVAPPALPAPASTYEQGLRERALASARQGRLGEAATGWEILAALRPDAAGYRERLADTRRTIESLVPERFRAAQQTLRRGELDAATTQFLAVLALQPDHAGAADALRTIERERNRIFYLGKLSRITMERRSDVLQAAPARPRVPLDRNEIEHAVLLGSQGEYDDAIGILERHVAADRRDTRACHLLADMYFQKAEKQLPRDAAGAIGTYEKSLRLDANARAAARLKQLKTTPPLKASPLCP